MRALYIIIPILCILATEYRYHSALIAANAFAAALVVDQRPTHVEVLAALPGEGEDRVQAQTGAGSRRACVSIAARTHHRTS